MGHMIPPDFPCLLIAAASPFNFGPYKGVNTAEYIVHHLCRGRVSEEAMKQSAARLVFKQDAFRLGLFQSDSPWVQSWVKFFEDQWRLGYLSVGDFVSFGVRFFVNARPSSIRMSYSSLSKQRSESCGSALPVGVNGGCQACVRFLFSSSFPTSLLRKPLPSCSVEVAHLGVVISACVAGASSNIP